MFSKAYILGRHSGFWHSGHANGSNQKPNRHTKLASDKPTQGIHIFLDVKLPLLVIVIAEMPCSYTLLQLASVCLLT